MTLFTALDDFLCRTLAVVPGTWGKLLYVSGLRQADGEYAHWGLARRYGPAAHDALEQAHRQLLLEILRTPIRELLREAQRSAAAEECTLPVYLDRLKQKGDVLLPRKMGGGSARHFNSVLESLAALARAGRDANRQAS